MTGQTVQRELEGIGVIHAAADDQSMVHEAITLGPAFNLRRKAKRAVRPLWQAGEVVDGDLRAQCVGQ